MTLLTRIDEALKARIAHNDNNSNPYDATSLLENRGLHYAIEAIRHLFAQPPTDEELRHMKTVLNDVFLRHGPFELSGWIDSLDDLARAAITADRGK